MSECKKAWKYLKGSEKDFEGAPEWATIRERMNDSREYFVERYECDKRYTNAIHKGDEFRFLVNDFGTGDIIAQREPVITADVEVVKYDPDKVDIAKEFLPKGYPEKGQINHKCGELKIDGEWHDATINKYTRDCKGVQVDVYDVLQAFDVTNPALQHLIKKALCVGIRGHKTKQQDLQDIIDSAIRAKELEQ